MPKKPIDFDQIVDKPGGMVVGRIAFLCDVSGAMINMEIKQEKGLIHVTTAHKGVDKQTPVIELFTKLMKAIKG